MVQSSPMREAVRYKEKNMKWTASDFKVKIFFFFILEIFTLTMMQRFGDAHANALVEHGFSQGETIAIWHRDCTDKVHLNFSEFFFQTIIDCNILLTTACLPLGCGKNRSQNCGNRQFH